MCTVGQLTRTEGDFCFSLDSCANLSWKSNDHPPHLLWKHLHETYDQFCHEWNIYGLPGSSTCIYTVLKSDVHLPKMDTYRVDWYLNVYHIPVHVSLQNETTGTSALKGQTVQQAGNSHSDHVLVVMGRSNSSGLCSVATWMNAIFLMISAPHSIISWRWGSLWIQWLTLIAPCH